MWRPILWGLLVIKFSPQMHTLKRPHCHLIINDLGCKPQLGWLYRNPKEDRLYKIKVFFSVKIGQDRWTPLLSHSALAQILANLSIIPYTCSSAWRRECGPPKWRECGPPKCRLLEHMCVFREKLYLTPRKIKCQHPGMCSTPSVTTPCL